MVMSLSSELITAESFRDVQRTHKGLSRFLKEVARSRADHIAVIATLTSALRESAAATMGATQNTASAIAPNSTMAISKIISLLKLAHIHNPQNSRKMQYDLDGRGLRLQARNYGRPAPASSSGN